MVSETQTDLGEACRAVMALEASPGPWLSGGATDDEGWKVVTAPGTNPSHDEPDGAEWVATFYDGNWEGPGPNLKLAALAPVLRDLLCGEGGALDLLGDFQEGFTTLGAQTTWYAKVQALLRDATEKLPGGGAQAGGAG